MSENAVECIGENIVNTIKTKHGSIARINTKIRAIRLDNRNAIFRGRCNWAAKNRNNPF